MKKGFTLIEIMVVTAIIVVITTIAVITFGTVRENARDNERIADLQKIHVALGVYYARYGYYPKENATVWCDSSTGGKSSTSDCNGGGDDWNASSDLRDLVTENIIQSLPLDPINTSTYFYHIEFDKAGQGSPACPNLGDNESCRYVIQTLLENGEKADGSRGQCIYSLVGGSGDPNGGWDPPTDCRGTISPTTWSSASCCAQ